MKPRGLSLTLALALLLPSPTTAHYSFPSLIANETIFPPWKYVRYSLSASPSYLEEHPAQTNNTLVFPMYDRSSVDFRCGWNGTITGRLSDVAVVRAGSGIGVRTSFYKIPAGQTGFHDGPLNAYLTRSPDQSASGLQSWDGDGEYFKIATRGPYSETKWWNMGQGITFTTWNFSIPATTPPGFYLLRVDSIYPTVYSDKAQLYASCAQLEILGDGGGTPGPLVRFPGGYDGFDESFALTEEIRKNLTLYKMPGPELWTG